MRCFNGYEPNKELDLVNGVDGIDFGEYEKDGSSYEVLYILHNAEYSEILEVILRDKIRPLINEDIEGMQKIVNAGPRENGDVFIVYEKLDKNEDGFIAYEKPNNALGDIQVMRNIAKGLRTLKGKNYEKFIFSRNYIKDRGKLPFIGLFPLFKKIGMLDRNYLSENVLDWLNGNSKDLPNYQDDIYSLVKCFENSLLEVGGENAEEILRRGLESKRPYRFNKYDDLIDLLDKICLQKRGNLKIITKEEQPTKEFLQILDEMNKSCELCVNFEKGNKEQIAVRFRTDNWSGVFYVDELRNYVFIPVQHCKPRIDYKTDTANWFLADFSFSFDCESTFNCLRFFEKKYKKEINQLASLSKEKKDNVGKWQMLPEKEREFIEENAFKVKYDNVKFRGTNAAFYLTNGFNNWETVKNLKNEGTLIYATPGINSIGSDPNLGKVGKIGEFHSGNNVIVIKDILCDKEEIAAKGILYEDTKPKTGQFKKQVEACQMFLEQKALNKNICSFLADSDKAKIPPNKFLDSDNYGNFRNDVFNKDLDEAQLRAVLDATTYKPIYLIQGPPGTGKTTVIVECIRQIIKCNPYAKILVTSQSNLAVDNVLEKIAKLNQEEGQKVSFIRLASESEDGDINVTDSIKEHTYEKKVKNWINEAIEKNKKFMKDKFEAQENNETLFEFYKSAQPIENIETFKKALNKQPNNYIKNLFENVKTMQDVKEVFEKYFGKEYLKLKSCQAEWRAFLSNATLNDEKLQSKLNYGNDKINFLDAMIMKANVIGSTCIHIASSRYRKVNFKFDYVIMDESSKATPAESLVPIIKGRNIILIGDHKQLPPVITREEAIRQKIKDEVEDNGLDIDKEFGESLFEKLITSFENNKDNQKYIRMLDTQYRMPGQIGCLISEFFYDGKLKNPDEKIAQDFNASKEHGLNLKKETSIVFISTSKRSNPNDNGNKFFRQNQCNMQTIKEVLAKLNELCSDNLEKELPFTIGIIAGYRGQVDLLSKNINLDRYGSFVQCDKNGNQSKLIEINTVDKFQGAERDIIIYDIVRSDSGSSNIGFLDDYRRINVAFSRAKRLLIIVGDSEYIIKRATLNPDGKFKEFKLKHIAEDLQKKGFIFNTLEEVF